LHAVTMSFTNITGHFVILGEQAARKAAGAAITGCDICGGASKDIKCPGLLH